MIHFIKQNNVQTDLSIKVNPDNNMELLIDFSFYKNRFVDIKRKRNLRISFSPDNKYDKLVSIHIINNGKLIIDEPLDNVFYFESIIPNRVEKICWFTIPKNYNNENGLNNINIYFKGGDDDE